MLVDMYLSNGQERCNMSEQEGMDTVKRFLDHGWAITRIGEYSLDILNLESGTKGVVLMYSK